MTKGSLAAFSNRLKTALHFLIYLALCAARPLIAAECEQLPKPSLNIKPLEEKTSYNTQYSYRALTQLAASLARPDKRVLGLTRGNASVTFSLQLPSVQDASGRWECSSPQLTLTYGFSPMTVYVAREFPEGSCAYKEILEHEMRHVKAYQAHLASIEKEVQATLSQRFVTGEVWRGPTGFYGEQIKKEIDERWVPYVQRMLRRVEEAQAVIDTPEEYERVANACEGEIKKKAL